MNTFGYEIKIIPNKIWFLFPEKFSINGKQYYLIKKSQYMTKKAIEACKTLEEFEEFINSLKEVEE